MQTHDLRLNAYIGKPDSLVHSRFQLPLGINKYFVTYLITGVPVDVPTFEVIRVCKRLLSCRDNAYQIYEFTWAELYCENRR